MYIYSDRFDGREGLTYLVLLLTCFVIYVRLFEVAGASKDVQELGLVAEGEEGNPPARKILESKGCLAKQRLAVDRYVERACPFTKKLFQCSNLHVHFSELPWAITNWRIFTGQVTAAAENFKIKCYFVALSAWPPHMMLRTAIAPTLLEILQLF